MLPVLEEDKCRESLLFVQNKYPNAYLSVWWNEWNVSWSGAQKGCLISFFNHGPGRIFFNHHSTGGLLVAEDKAQICQKG